MGILIGGGLSDMVDLIARSAIADAHVADIVIGGARFALVALTAIGKP